MKLRVLGCSGGIGPGLRTTALMIDNDVLIDCGSGVGDHTRRTEWDSAYLSHAWSP